MFDRVTELNPDDAGGWLRKGACQINLGNDSDGMADLRHALKLDPSFHPAAEVVARMLVLDGNWDEAWEVLAEPFGQPSPKPHFRTKNRANFTTSLRPFSAVVVIPGFGPNGLAEW